LKSLKPFCFKKRFKRFSKDSTYSSETEASAFSLFDLSTA